MYDINTIKKIVDILIPEGENGEPPASQSRGAIFIIEYIKAKKEYYLDIDKLLTLLAEEKILSDEILKRFEDNFPDSFHRLVELVYTAYYGDPEIVEKLGLPKPPQPAGHSMKPFDIKIIENMLKRAGNV